MIRRGFLVDGGGRIRIAEDFDELPAELGTVFRGEREQHDGLSPA